MRKLIFIGFLFAVQFSFAQQLGTLTVEKIMRDPKWIGTSPSNPSWSTDGKYLFFSWNPEGADSDSTYYVTLSNPVPQKASFAFRQSVAMENNSVWNKNHDAYVFSRSGDLFYFNTKDQKQIRITQTEDNESNPRFIEGDKRIAFTQGQNLYAWDIGNGSLQQLTNFTKGGPRKEAVLNDQEKWLEQNSLETSLILQERKAKREKADSARKAQQEKGLEPIYLQDKNIFNINISPDGRFVTYSLSKPGNNGKNTIIPSFVTESGFTTDINGRTKVGAPQTAAEFFIFDREKDTVMQVKTAGIPGIKDLPDYVKDYPQDSIKPKARDVRFIGPVWSPNGTNALVEVRSLDNKDRWLMKLNAASGSLQLLDRQRDEAWIGGPGIGWGFFGAEPWIDENNFWFQSEATGYSHLYRMNVVSGEKKQLTSGNFEVQSAQLSPDKKTFYITTNEVHPGEKQFYQLPVNGGKAVRITQKTGGNVVNVSPDGKTLAVLYSYSNRPPELYLQENKPGAAMKQVTSLAMSDEFKSYAWRDPEVITFTARDGAAVYARLYKPENMDASKPAVIFVHGAGYLQNAHKWWSDSYFREYMFNNLLADNGYTVLDIDYRGSAGYGRDWRTGIYRFMGGKDLTDQVDGAKYLVEKFGVNPEHIGLYGGSYGGFITLMAMFTQPEIFKAGAALRSVTDWAHYNHGYTSNILNEPYTDSIAYRKSSPIYYAEGLKGHLLMAHGMVDTNVHFQDIVRLTQRLIELGKDNWELAVYPMENHGFVEPSSWTDEYKRIFKLFEETLKE